MHKCFKRYVCIFAIIVECYFVLFVVDIHILLNLIHEIFLEYCFFFKKLLGGLK